MAHYHRCQFFERVTPLAQGLDLPPKSEVVVLAESGDIGRAASLAQIRLPDVRAFVPPVPVSIVLIADLLRLLVVPVFGWIAYRDYKTRRVPSRIWYPIVIVGLLALGLDITSLRGDSIALRLLFVRVLVSVGVVGPLAYAFYRLGAFGPADAKAMMALAVVFPTYPSFELGGWTLPVVVSNTGVFSLSVITDGVIVGALYPLAIAIINLRHGNISPVMFVAKPTDRSTLLETPGKLFENGSGFTIGGLDLDALRMYLRWRGLSLTALLENPDAFRRPSTLPVEPNEPTDGAVDPDADPTGGAAPPASYGGDQADDPWGAAKFLDSLEDSAYGTDPETLRESLELLAERESVWVSPGLPFIVPLFFGLLVALTYGDVLFGIMQALGMV